jgi:hypothetical protein
MDQKSWQHKTNIFIMLEDVKHFHHSEAEENGIGGQYSSTFLFL